GSKTPVSKGEYTCSRSIQSSSSSSRTSYVRLILPSTTRALTGPEYSVRSTSEVSNASASAGTSSISGARSQIRSIPDMAFQLVSSQLAASQSSMRMVWSARQASRRCSTWAIASSSKADVYRWLNSIGVADTSPGVMVNSRSSPLDKYLLPSGAVKV